MGPRSGAGQALGRHLFSYVEMQLHLNKSRGSVSGGLWVGRLCSNCSPWLSGLCAFLGPHASWSAHGIRKWSPLRKTLSPSEHRRPSVGAGGEAPA